MRIWTALAFVLMFGTPALAADYYVDPVNGLDTNNGSIGAPWQKLYRARTTLNAGDTLHLRGGTYVNDVYTAVRSGAPGKPITIKAYEGEVVKITSVGSYGAVIFLNNMSHFVIENIVFEDCTADAGAIVITNSSDMIIRNCSFIRSLGAPIKIRQTVRTLIEKCYFDTHGSPTAAGSGDHVVLQGASHNIVQGNYFTKAGHYAILLQSFVGTYSTHNKILNNRIDNYWGGGINVVLGSEYNLFEGNVISNIGNELPGYPKTGIQLTADNNTARRNVIHTAAHTNSGIYFGAYTFQGTVQHSRNNYVYNNTLYNIGGAGVAYAQKDAAINTGNVFANNIIYKARQAGEYTGGGVPNASYYFWFDTYHANANWEAFPNGNIVQNNWLETKGHVAYVKKAGAQAGQWGKPMEWVQTNFPASFFSNHVSDADPRFADEAKNTFSLMSDSPLIDKGVVIDDIPGKTGGWGNLSHCGVAPDIGAFEACITYCK